MQQPDLLLSKPPRMQLAAINFTHLKDQLFRSLSNLSLSHRLMIIYLLSFVSVAMLAYSLIVEKNLAIGFAEGEQRGSRYSSVLRDTLLMLVNDKLLTRFHRSATQDHLPSSLTEQAAALATAEDELGKNLGTADLANQLRLQLRRLDSEGSKADLSTLQDQAITTALVLLSRISERSNLILDPDLDSYYTMSMALMRLPLIVTIAADLAEMATDLPPRGGGLDDSRSELLLTEGAFSAAASGLASDAEAAFRASADGSLAQSLKAPAACGGISHRRVLASAPQRGRNWPLRYNIESADCRRETFPADRQDRRSMVRRQPRAGPTAARAR